MSRTAFLSVLAAAIVLAPSADAANPKVGKKGVRRLVTDLAPAQTVAGPAIDLAPLDPAPDKGKIDHGGVAKHKADPMAKEKRAGQELGKGNLAVAPAITASGPVVDLAPLDPPTDKGKIDHGPVAKHKADPAAKEKRAGQELGKGNLAVAPAITASGPGADVAPIEPVLSVDIDPQSPTVVICFTDEMLRLYLHWLGMDLRTALAYGLLEDPRAIALFFEALRRGDVKGSAADSKGEDTWLVDFQRTN